MSKSQLHFIVNAQALVTDMERLVESGMEAMRAIHSLPIGKYLTIEWRPPADAVCGEVAKAAAHSAKAILEGVDGSFPGVTRPD